MNLTTGADIRYVVGSASYGSPQVTGDVQGTVLGDDVQLKIVWRNGLVGIYNGKIGADETISGTGYEVGNPKKKVSWVSTRAMVCRQAAQAKPKPVVPAQKPAIPHSPPQKPPPETSSASAAATITAYARVVTIPAGQTFGTTTLTWDAGPKHPYAEVWVKVDDEDETKIVEEGKGSRRVTVELGKTYRYILTDSSQTLATVTVKTKQ